jgi:nitrite reductase/ring-hydroxylating ferredoxin subunit
MSDDTKLHAICDAAAVVPDTPVQAWLEGVAYAVFTIGGRYYVTQDSCTHGPGSMSEGLVMGEEVECPFHQGRFHIPSGRPTAAPCTEALRVWTAQAVEGKICIDPRERRTTERGS